METVEKSQKVRHLNVEEGLSKSLHKLVLYSVKIIPIVISGIYILNTVLSYFGIDWPGFSYIVTFLFIGFMYLSSIAFKFCLWHRVFIHYIFLTLILNIIDYHWGIPLSDRGLFLMYMTLTGIVLFGALWAKLKCTNKN